MRTQLAALALVVPGVVAVERRVAVAILGRPEGQHSDRGLLAVAIRKTKVLDRGFGRTIGTRIDMATGSLFGWGVGIEQAFTGCTGT